MFGLVRSNPMIVLIQIVSRVFLVWGVANYIPHVSESKHHSVTRHPSSRLGPVDHRHLSGSDRVECHGDHPLRLLRSQSISTRPSVVDMVQVSGVMPMLLSSHRLLFRYSFFIVLYPLGVTVISE